ncbi:unnamed protein product [Prunus armeniaca]
MVRHFPAQLSDLVPSVSDVLGRDFDVGLWTSVVGLPRVRGGEVALMFRSVGLIPKEGAEGKPWPWFSPRVRHSLAVHFGTNRSPPSPLARVFGRGFEVVFGRNYGPTRLTLAKSEGGVELTGEGTSEHFDFRASRAVCSPQDERHVAKVMMARGASMRRLVFRGAPLPTTPL